MQKSSVFVLLGLLFFLSACAPAAPGLPGVPDITGAPSSARPSKEGTSAEKAEETLPGETGAPARSGTETVPPGASGTETEKPETARTREPGTSDRTAPPDPPPATDAPPGIRLGIAWPPAANAEHLDFTEKIFKELNADSMRISVHWRLTEKTKGVLNWTRFDLTAQYARKNGWKVMVTFESDAPDWVRSGGGVVTNERSCALDDEANGYFIDFVRAFFTRYRGVFNIAQYGNEWQTEWAYPGSASAYKKTSDLFYDAVKAADPGVKVALGGFSIGALRILALTEGKISALRDDNGRLYSAADLPEYLSSRAGKVFSERIELIAGTGKYDILDIHLYDDPENWKIYHDIIKARYPGAPRIVSEFGGPHPVWQDDSPAAQAAEYPKYIAALNSLEILGAYSFSLVDSESAVHYNSGLIGLSLLKKPAFYVFKSYNAGK